MNFPLLKPGDHVTIVAPARKISREELQTGISILESWGLKVILNDDVFAIDHQFAGNDAIRLRNFQHAIEHPDIKAIFCARGGYGTLRIIDQLDFSPLKHHPKWIVGYSDITVLHNELLSRRHLSSLHATMPINMPANTTEALNSLRKILFEGNIQYEIPPHTLNRTGEAKGILFGGNLSMIYALNGSRSLPDPGGKILFLEDLDEYLYHLDRMMLNLKRAGILQELAGVVIGGFTDMKDNVVPFGKTAEEIISEHLSSYSYPVCFGFPAGHIADNRAMIMGADTAIIVENDRVVFRQ